MELLKCLESLGHVAAVRGGWQLTVDGMQVLRHGRSATKFSRVFEVRRGIAWQNLTQWELLDSLLEKGWRLQARQPRVKLKPIMLSKDVDVVDVIFYEKKKLELAKQYLMALNQTKAQANSGASTLCGCQVGSDLLFFVIARLPGAEAWQTREVLL